MARQLSRPLRRRRASDHIPLHVLSVRRVAGVTGSAKSARERLPATAPPAVVVTKAYDLALWVLPKVENSVALLRPRGRRSRESPAGAHF